MDTFQFYFLVGCCAVYFLIGCYGNTISICIFNKKEFKTQPTTTYLISLNVVNIICIVYLPFIIIAQLWTDIYDETISCQIFFGFMYILSETQSLIYSLCSLDRCITIFAPFNYLKKNKLKFQLAILFVILFPVVLLSVPTVYYAEKQVFENQTVCEFKYDWSFQYSIYQFTLLRTVIPFLVTISASLLTIYKLIASKLRLQARDWKKMKREYHFARSVIIMDLIFLVVRIPTLININIQKNMRFLYTFLYSVFGLLGALHSVLFFFIFIIFNKIYRDLFKKIFSRKSNRVDVNRETNEFVLVNISNT
jgi:hypothetical protein